MITRRIVVRFAAMRHDRPRSRAGAHGCRTWVTRGKDIIVVVNDLAQLKGIGPKHSEMLKSIGVDSVKELQHRNAASLKQMIESRHGKVVGLSEKTCQTWIDE